MKKSRNSNSQVLNILKQAENGVHVSEPCRENGGIALSHDDEYGFELSTYKVKGGGYTSINI